MKKIKFNCTVCNKKFNTLQGCNDHKKVKHITNLEFQPLSNTAFIPTESPQLIDFFSFFKSLNVPWSTIKSVEFSCNGQRTKRIFL